MEQNTENLRNRFAKVFGALMEKPEVARDIAFHMTDWDHNLQNMSRLYEHHETLSDDDTTGILIQFLAHVPEHVAAAKKLAGVGPIADVFDVGVNQEDED